MDRLGPYELNQIYRGECSTLMAQLPDNSIPMWITSPPYDELRGYNGYTFKFESVARELYRITQVDGIGVWIVGDQTNDFCESLTEAKQKIYFVEQCGFSLLDTMIYQKLNYAPGYPTLKRYVGTFEYMMVLCKGVPRVFNPIQAKRVESFTHLGNYLKPNGSFEKGDGFEKRKRTKTRKKTKDATNVWAYSVGGKGKRLHPAPFPEALARDHILSWSNPGDLVFDPMIGSGTTAKEAWKLGRKFLGFEISQEYVDIANKRLEKVMSQPFMPGLVEPSLPQPEQLGLL